jgi:general secretion pathway protein H
MGDWCSVRERNSPAKRHSKSGFMLLDMVLALTIMLLLFAIVWPFLGRNTSSAQQAATALDIATLLRVDRATAGKSGVATGTRIDLNRRILVGANGRQILVPADLTLNVLTGTNCRRSASEFIIAFLPDGSSCGGIISLEKNNLSYAVRFNWLTGLIDVVQTTKS